MSQDENQDATSEATSIATDTMPAPARTGLGRGWKSDLRAHIDECARTESIRSGAIEARLGKRLGVSPLAVNLLGRHVDVRDQKFTSACVGFAIAGALQTRLTYLGYKPGRFSPLAIYAIARQLEGLYKNKPLPDDGSFPFLAMSGVKRFGMVSEDKWAFDDHVEDRVQKEIPIDVFSTASQFRISNFSRIDANGATRSKLCMAALAKGHPVLLGMQVGSEFERYQSGNDPIGAETTNTGGHMTYLVGYEDGGRVFIGANSWTRNWGDNGLYKIRSEKLEHESTTDLYEFVVAGS